MSDWIEWGEWRRYTPGPCPVPHFLRVDVELKPSGVILYGKAPYEVQWSAVSHWRPGDPNYECKFDGDRLVAYRRKEPNRD